MLSVFFKNAKFNYMNKYLYLLIAIISFALIYLYFNNLKYFFLNENNSKLTRENFPNVLETREEEINYYDSFTGYYVEPELEGNYPGIIMIHEWWGLNDHIKEMARQLSSQGYRVLAVDLFGKVATTPEEAMKQSRGLNQEEALKNMGAAKEYLTKRGSQKIGSLGWCFGGAQSLQISLNQNLDATVIYYGNLNYEKETLQNMKSPVLGIFGSKDAQIPVEKVNTFQNDLASLNIDNDIKIYEGVGHAFANPSGQNYSPNETKDAWNKTLKFLENNLKE